MNTNFDKEIEDYLTRVLLRYFTEAVSVTVDHPELSIDHDLELLRLHWAVSEPIRNLVIYLREHPHQIQAVLETRIREDDAQVRGRFDVRETSLRRMVTEQPTLMISLESVSTYASGPNHLLIWVLEQAWQLAKRFEEFLPREDSDSQENVRLDMVNIGDCTSYRSRIYACTPVLASIRRFDAIHQAAKKLDMSRRPSAQAVNESSRSRQPIYKLASLAYRSLQAIETGDENAICALLDDTLLGPLETWRRYELAVGLGLANSLSKVLGKSVHLNFLAGGRQPIASVADYEIHWQPGKSYWKEPVHEPSEAIASRLLKSYGMSRGASLPDLIVVDRAKKDVVAVIEVKHFDKEEKHEDTALRAATEQLVRYARGYREPEKIQHILRHSIAALWHFNEGRYLEPQPEDVHWVMGFEGIKGNRLEQWAAKLHIR